MAAELLPQQPMAPDGSLSRSHLDDPALLDYLGRRLREVDTMLARNFPNSAANSIRLAAAGKFGTPSSTARLPTFISPDAPLP